MLTARPGHYETPRFSTDGRQIVYERGGGSGLRGGLHTLDTGLYVMDADGSDARRVTTGGRDPRFSADGTRLIYLTGGGLSKQVRSIDLDGADCQPQECGERTHFTLEYATDLVPSPDGRYVAFVEAFNVYVAPFPQTGGPVALSKDTKAIPVTRVSRDAGTDLHWTDASTLRWLIGEEVFTRSLDDAFAFRPGAPENLPAPDSTGTPIGLVVDHAQPDGVVAFVGARIVTVEGDRVIEDGTVVVRGNRIEAVGPRAEVDVPRGAEVIDVAGATIMPGIVDVHAHGHFGSGPLPQANWIYYANLAFGVTTMHDPSASTELVFSLSEMVKAGEIVGPRVFSTGSILYGADGDIRVQINALDDARSHLRRLQAVGAFSVKSYNQPRRDQRQQVLAAARELDMLVMPEGGSTFFHNVNMVVDGHTGIEHAVPVAPLYDDVLTLWGETGVAYTPTLIVGYGGLWGENYWYAESNVWENERLLRFTPRGTVDARSRRRTLAPDTESLRLGERPEPAGRGGATRRPRSAPGPRRAVGVVDDGAGRHEPARCHPGRHAGRRRVPRHGGRPRLHHRGQAGRLPRARRRPARRSPADAEHPLHRRQRARVRSRDDGPGMAGPRPPPDVLVRAPRRLGRGAVAGRRDGPPRLTHNGRFL